MFAYIATISVPGYLPARDDPPVFDTPEAAWDHLAAERRADEDQVPGIPDDPADPHGPCHYSDTVAELENYTNRHVHATGTVYGPTPGRDDDGHDLGLAYSVDYADEDVSNEAPDAATLLEQASRPHPAGRPDS